MNEIWLKARAKVNLALDVLGKREDGYHDLNMIMQSLALCDHIGIKKVSKKNYLKINTNLPWLPVDRRNLIYQAAELLMEEYSLPEGVFIQLEKQIPVSAGLAGGSSDCAAVLVGMRNLFGLPIDNGKLMAIGKQLGADVPFCVMRGTAQAEGIGDRLTRLPPLPRGYVLLAKPPAVISTAEVFKKFMPEKVDKRPDVEKLKFYIRQGNLQGICGEFCNVLESITAEEKPVIKELKNHMVEGGALSAVMSGTGPSVFGVFEKKREAFFTMLNLRQKFPEVKEVFLTSFFNVY